MILKRFFFTRQCRVDGSSRLRQRISVDSVKFITFGCELLQHRMAFAGMYACYVRYDDCTSKDIEFCPVVTLALRHKPIR